MSGRVVDETSVLSARYRCAGAYDIFETQDQLSANAGFFEFSKEIVCYGRASVNGSEKPDGELRDALDHVVLDRGKVVLPFDPNDIIENLRRERYVNSEQSAPAGMIRKIYYAFRPLMPVGFRKHLQRMYLNRWRQIAFPRWPVDHTIEDIFERLVFLSLQSRQYEQMPFVWFWPNGYSGCLILTHDVETAAGRDFCLNLADMDSSFGMKSSFQIVPRDSYEVPRSFLQALEDRGSEINLHGLTHDGQLFRDRTRFLDEVKQINQIAKEYGATGFRSPVMYRNLDWYGDLNLAYDMSVPNVAHLDPQRGGCCTVMPYFIGNILELPLTTTQDYTLFNILGETSIDLWKRQIKLVLDKHGLLSFNIHPDYVMAEPYRRIYRELLRFLQEICAQRNIWMALPGEVDVWWRERQQMSIVHNENSGHVVGPNSARARLAYARVEDQRITYHLPKRRPDANLSDKAITELLARKVSL